MKTKNGYAVSTIVRMLRTPKSVVKSQFTWPFLKLSTRLIHQELGLCAATTLWIVPFTKLQFHLPALVKVCLCLPMVAKWHSHLIFLHSLFLFYSFASCPKPVSLRYIAGESVQDFSPILQYSIALLCFCSFSGGMSLSFQF